MSHAHARPLCVAILAAGLGKRMRSALPKVLHPLAGRPLLAHVIDTARELSAGAIQVVHGHGGERVTEQLADAQVGWVEQAEQLGTGHALMQAMPAIADEASVLVLYGDVPLTRAETLRALVTAAGDDGVALLTAELEDPSGYGRILRAADGGVTGIVEQKDASPAELAIAEINTGMLCAPAARLRAWLARLGNDNAQGEYYLTDVIAMAVAEGVAVASVQPRSVDEILGANDRRQLAALERIYQRREAERLMDEGVTLLDPARFDVRGRVRAGRDVTIDVNVVLEGDVQLGDGVHIGANCVLRDVQVGEGSVIHPNTLIERAVVGRRCQLGPFARIRPDSVLDEGARVGNFVELKKTHLGAGSKVNHLAYVGDTTIGRAVNVGAGTITCNYDGVNKHRTVIGDGAFIGSDTQLVAPVTVGENAVIGAGSTITRDAPAGELTVSRARQITVRGWKRTIKKGKEER